LFNARILYLKSGKIATIINMSVKEVEGCSGRDAYPVRLCFGSLDKKDLDDFKAVRKISDLGVVIALREDNDSLVVFADGGNHEAKEDAVRSNSGSNGRISFIMSGQLSFNEEDGRAKSLFLANVAGGTNQYKSEKAKLVFDAIKPELLPLKNIEINFGTGSSGLYVASSKEIMIW
jgi:hypothetical protein